MIRHHVDWSGGTFKVVSPDTESLEDSQEFLVMGVVIEFRGGKCAGVKSHRVDFAGILFNRENSSQCVVGSVSLNNERSVGYPMSKDRGGCESGFESFKGFSSCIGKIPLNTLSGKSGEQNNDVGIVGNETSIEVGEP